ncbi:flagellar basal body-associated FliL family protein [Desulfovibrio inopinatus]|uniref:flagellar basal body-associated FliL family protein n=1 Tax=Desulfovibrio inopinatus TaxID=102109 RepID=UPI00040DD49E|nr:flagellar basal body-associated FliL family protein [Desulfovibrio inopinatus]
MADDDFPLSDDELTKAKLDDSELSEESPKSLQKVELDLDDAPFLEEEEEEPEPEEPEVEEPEPEEEKAPVPFWKRKKILLILLALLLLLVGSGTYYFNFVSIDVAPPDLSSDENTPTETEAPTEMATGTEATAETPTPPPPPPPPPPEYAVDLEPFLIEQRDPKGPLRILGLKFSSKTIDPNLVEEIKQKNIILRDAVYYYLKNKDLVFLTNDKYSQTLKQDILTVMNQYLATGQLDTILIEEYVVR